MHEHKSSPAKFQAISETASGIRRNLVYNSGYVVLTPRSSIGHPRVVLLQLCRGIVESHDIDNDRHETAETLHNTMTQSEKTDRDPSNRDGQWNRSSARTS